MTLERQIFGSDAWSYDSMSAELASPWTEYTVVIDQTAAIVGYVGVAWTPTGGQADINTIALHPSVRGQGWGTRLLQHALRTAIRHGAVECLLEVRADNPVARSLYVNNGFQQIAVRPNYYQPDGVDAIIMRLDLRSSLPQAGEPGSAAATLDNRGVS